MLYEAHTCDLVISSSSRDVYRLNLEQGRFMQSYTTGNVEGQGINRVAQSPLGCLLGFASESGTVELWDTTGMTHRLLPRACEVHVMRGSVCVHFFQTIRFQGLQNTWTHRE